MLTCLLCNGALTYLGKLGALCWFRCRHCGAECPIHEQEMGG